MPSLSLCTTTLYAAASLAVSPAAAPSTGWKTLADDDTQVACTRDGPEPWCKASGHIAAPPDRVYALLKNIGGHPAIFDRVTVSVEISPGLAHQVVSLPFPLSPRDYLVQMSHDIDGVDRLIRFSSVDDPAVPVTGIRLAHAAGEFRVHPTADGTTDFSYLWQADLGPDIPGFALSLAWESQGREMVEGLRKAAYNRSQ